MATALEHEKSFLMQDSASTVWDIALYEDSLLLTSSNDIVQKDIQTGAIQRTFRAHKKPIYSFVVTNDSRMISSAYDDMIIVWNLETGSILKRIGLRSSETRIRSISFKNNEVFAGGWDSKIRQVDLVSGRVVRTIPFVGLVYSIAAAFDFVFVAQTLAPYVVKLSSESGAFIQSFEGHSNSALSLFVWNNLLFSGADDLTVICWDVVNGEIVRKFVGHSAAVYSVAVFEGELYSTAAFGIEFFKWNVSDGQITMKFKDVQKNVEVFDGSQPTSVIPS